MIAAEWDSVQLRDVATFSGGMTPSRARQSDYFDSGTIPWVKTMDLTNGDVAVTDERITGKAIGDTGIAIQPEGAVLVAMYGGFNQIGRTGLLRRPAAVNQAITAVRPNARRLDSEFLVQILNHNVDYWKSVASSSRKDPNITKEDVRAFPLRLPPITEQRQIAGALCAADDLVAALERMVTKKQAIKQGMMQQLLTGRTRLPEFTAPWTTRAIGDFAQVKAGGTPSTAVPRYWGGDIRWMSSGEIHAKRIREVSGRITTDGLRESAAQLLPVGTVLMALAGQGKTRGTVAVTRVELSTNQSIAGILPSNEHDSDFLYYNLDTRYYELRGESSGDGGRGGLNLTIIKKLTVHMPEPAEQRAIAGVLSDVDDHLAALNARLLKARNVKQGMMQQLLSGRTRLPVEEAAA